MARTTTWRSSRWARWLGWTVVYGLVFVGSLCLSSLLASPGRQVMFIGLLLEAAFLIGVRFPSWWWTAGPAAVLLALNTALTLQNPIGFVVISALLAMSAAAGVWWGRRRKATKVGSRESSLSGDAATAAKL